MDNSTMMTRFDSAWSPRRSAVPSDFLTCTRWTVVEHSRRRGSALLEVQVAFAVLGIGLAGMCPFVLMQLRLVRKLEARLQGQIVMHKRSNGQDITLLEAKDYYIVPWENPWARKLVGSAQILESAASPCDPGPLPVRSRKLRAFPVSIVTLETSPRSEEATVHVEVAAP
jgi:hypothetical protein